MIRLVDVVEMQMHFQTFAEHVATTYEHIIVMRGNVPVVALVSVPHLHLLLTAMLDAMGSEEGGTVN